MYLIIDFLHYKKEKIEIKEILNMNIESITLGYIFNLFLFFLPGIVTYIVKNLRYYKFFPNIKVKEIVIESIFYTLINYFILGIISILKVDNQIIRIILKTLMIILACYVVFKESQRHKKIKKESNKILSRIAMSAYFLFYLLFQEKVDFKLTLGLIDIDRNYEFHNLRIIASYLSLPILFGVFLYMKDSRIPNFFPNRWLRNKKVTKCEITDKNTGKIYIGFLYQIIFEENVRMIFVTEEEEEVFLELKASDLMIKDLYQDKYI